MSVDLHTGALVVQRGDGSPDVRIPFQFSPSTVKRRLTPRMVGGGAGDQSARITLAGPPQESVSIEILLDATSGEAQPGDAGVRPMLDALELLFAPSTQAVERNQKMLDQGIMEIIPYPLPNVQLVLGPHRVLPVKVVSMTIEETMLSPTLDPLRAFVALELEVVDTSQVAPGTPGYRQFTAYQQSRERLAALGRKG